MGQLKLGVIGILLLVSYALGVAGLKCYQCSYEKLANGTELGQQSCMDGRIPDEKFLEDCGHGKGHWGCLVVTADGESDDDRGRRTYTVRECVPSHDQVPPRCYKQSAGEWKSGHDTLSRAVTYKIIGFTGNTPVSACYCTGDKCNSGSSLALSFGLMALTGVVALVFNKF